MSTRLLVIDSRWTVPEKGIVLGPGLTSQQLEVVRVGGGVTLKAPNKEPIKTCVVDIYTTTWMVDGVRSRTRNLVVPEELGKDNLPEGTELWWDDE